eukprot:11091834-Heterocapsa_arctica.AAC.1
MLSWSLRKSWSMTSPFPLAAAGPGCPSGGGRNGCGLADILCSRQTPKAKGSFPAGAHTTPE